MEVQCNVIKGDGERADTSFKGRTLIAWTNGIQTWKPFRIPYNAGTKPEYDLTTQMNFDLEAYAEGIGMTGWNWVDKVSHWVAYDFDAITGHSERHTRKCTDEELDKVKGLVQNVPWVEVRKSTGGKGLHLYVHVNNIATDTHHEHAALARSILGQLSSIVGFDFGAKIDIMGGNMWVWHRKMLNTDGLSLLKSATAKCEVPINWRDHIPVIRGDRKRVKLSNLDERDEEIFESLTTTRTMVDLDSDHKRFIEHLDKIGSSAYWDSDRGMLVGHTFEFGLACEELQLKGIFKTLSTGSERGTDCNAFAYPLKGGAWAVRRFTPGVEEAPTWTQDGAGWTRCYINRDLDLETAARAAGGIEDEKKYFFAAAEDAAIAVKSLGGQLEIPQWAGQRKAKIKKTDDNKLVIEVERTKEETETLKGWIPEGKVYRKVVQISQSSRVTDIDSNDVESKFRHIVTEDGADAGWVVHNDHGKWIEEPITNLKLAFKSLGFKAGEIDGLLGNSVMRPWITVNRPFQDEYPGNRIWNRTKAQFQFKPTTDKDKEDLYYPHWNRIFDHLGQSLDYAVEQHPWCKNNGINTGSDWLKCWVASLFQSPTEPLPYLFFYGPQNQGKSTLQEALELLIGKEGVMGANNALTSEQAFNGELLSAVVCVIEELDLGASKKSLAYNRIKDWTVGKSLQVHVKHMTPYKVPNTTHWIQIANDIRYCPIFPGDTRITMIEVKPLDAEQIIPKREFMDHLTTEAPDFLAAMLAMELPKPESRFNIPVLETFDKAQAQEMSRTPIEDFFNTVLREIQGQVISVQNAYEEYAIYCKDFCPDETPMSKYNFERHPLVMRIKGKRQGDMMVMLANRSIKEKPQGNPIIVKDGRFYSVGGTPL